MSIFSTKQYIEFDPNALLETIISTADFINDREEKLSYHTINDCPYPENYKSEEERCVVDINNKISDLIAEYNDMDNKMIEFIKNNPISLVNISDEEFTEYRSMMDIMPNIPFGRYLSIGLSLFKNTDMNNIDSKNELDQKIDILNKEFKNLAKVPLPDDRFFICYIYQSYSLNYDTFRLAGEALKIISTDQNSFNNPAPLLTGDYYLRLDVMRFLSLFKASLYSGYKTMVSVYNDCVSNIMRRD